MNENMASALYFGGPGSGLGKEDIDYDVVILEVMLLILAQSCSVLANNLHNCFFKSILCARNICSADLIGF